MLMCPAATAQSTRLRLQIVSGQVEERMVNEDLERLRSANPAAGALPLLRALATGGGGRVVLPHVNGLQLAVDVEPG
jgi:hypothetical protein